MTILPFILMILTVPAGAVLWGIYGLSGLIGLTSYAIRVCHDLVSACMAYTSLAKIFFSWTGVGLAAGGVLYAVVKGAYTCLSVRRALNKLPITAVGALNVIEDDNALSAFTCGILRPRVYMTRGLLRKLSTTERRAVLLHELHHKKNRDTLRFLALDFLKDALFYVPLAGYSARALRARKEKEADDSTADAMKEGLSLASALLKVAASRKNPSFAHTSFAGADPASRIRRILNGKDEGLHRPPFKTAAVSVVMAAFIAAAFMLPAVSGDAMAARCTKDHCTLHSARAGAHNDSIRDSGCTTHCDAAKTRVGGNSHEGGNTPRGH